MLAKYLGLIRQANPQILEVHRSNSEVLARIQAGFHAMIRAREQRQEPSINVTCFYEEIPLPGVGEIVPMRSAILPAYTHIGSTRITWQ